MTTISLSTASTSTSATSISRSSQRCSEPLDEHLAWPPRPRRWPGENTRARRPQPKSGRLTRSPGLVNRTSKIMSRTWSSSSVMATRPAPPRWKGTSRCLAALGIRCRAPGPATWALNADGGSGLGDRGEHDGKAPRDAAWRWTDHAAGDRGDEAPPVARRRGVVARVGAACRRRRAAGSARCSIAAAMLSAKRRGPRRRP